MNCQINLGIIDPVMTLWNERTDANCYFTIGGSEVSKTNFKLSDDMFKLRNN